MIFVCFRAPLTLPEHDELCKQLPKISGNFLAASLGQKARWERERQKKEQLPKREPSRARSQARKAYLRRVKQDKAKQDKAKQANDILIQHGVIPMTLLQPEQSYSIELFFDLMISHVVMKDA
ncbi:uncharacterized protein LOC113285441 [Papaver somniferum]|uniref:uncharacterized protein LOC113285441 n=1 Tax=Papaver somniferum TaxID=3469 RepID=UPI000E6F9537|nr:uncharacterized protein LOC113285441 [Papaver somniferum]